MLGSILSTVTSRLPLFGPMSFFGDKWGIQYYKLTEQEENILNKKITSFNTLWNKIFNRLTEEVSWEDIDFDTFVSINGQNTSNIVSNPIERGSFRAVNKVRKPKEIRVRIAKGGLFIGTENTLDTLKFLQNRTKRCRVITPFGKTDYLNLKSFNYSFTKENGAYLLIADLVFQEYIEKSVSVKKSKKAQDGDTQNVGVVALK